MEGIDIFATKGAEYLFCGAFLLALVVFWKLLNPPLPAGRREAGAGIAPQLLPWFQLPDSVLVHQGHAWARPVGADEVVVGMDDFAQKLLGRPAGIVLPPVGARVAQGDQAWQVQVDGHAIPMLSPVDGEVLAVNQDVIGSPGLVNAEPYDRGWLMRVRVPNPRAAARNLLTGAVARAWMDGITERLREMRAGELGIVLPDGGFPVMGFARAMAPDGWDDVARRFLLSD